MSKALIALPTDIEFDYFNSALSKHKKLVQQIKVGKIGAFYYPALDAYVAVGGLGKTQFGIQTQHLIDSVKNVSSVYCIGACGCLTEDLSIGDVVVAVETVEHDIKKHSRELIPRFNGDSGIIEKIRCLNFEIFGFLIRFGSIASGDEDIMSKSRKSELVRRTDAIAVAWEGAGGARACSFSNLPYVEVRGVTDFSNQSAESDFFDSLEQTMGNLAILLSTLLTQESATELS